MQSIGSSKLKLLVFPLILAVLFALAGCSESDSNSESEPLSPQELGYTKWFERKWIDTADNANSLIGSILLLKQNQELGQSEEANKNQAQIVNSFERLKDISQSNLDELAPVLPPNSMKSFHSEWLELLQAVQVAQSPEDMFVPSKEFLSEHAKLQEVFKGKSRKLLKEAGVTLSFQPVGIPVTGSVDLANFNFNLTFTHGISTPIGNVALAIPEKDTDKISNLVIIYQGKVQYITLAPGFEVYYNAVSCRQRLEDKGDTLVVELEACDTESFEDKSAVKPIPSPISTPTPQKVASLKRCIGIEFDFYPNFRLTDQDTARVALVRDTVGGFPAANALREGDIITLINKKVLESEKSLPDAVAGLASNESVNLYVLRPSLYEVRDGKIFVTPPYEKIDIDLFTKPCSKP